MAFPNTPRSIVPYDPYAAQAVTFADLPFLISHNATELIAQIAAVNASNAGGTIWCMPGTYTLPAGAGPVITSAGVRLMMYGCIIEFNPTAHDQAAITFNNSGVGGTLNYCGIKGARWKSTNTTFRKIALQCVDVLQFEVADCKVIGGEWTDASFLSEWLRTKGRQEIHVHDCYIYADLPVHITKNALFPSLSADHCWFGPAAEFCAAVGNLSVKVDGDAVSTNLTFDGFAFVIGGFKFIGTSATDAYHLSFRNGRVEQIPAAAWAFDIDGTPVLQALTFDNIRMGSGAGDHGIRIRNATYVDLHQVFYSGVGTVLDVDATVLQLKGELVRAQNPATASIVGQTLVRAGALPDLASPLESPFFEYQSTSSPSGVRVMQLGLREYTFVGTLAPGQFNFASFFDGTEKTIFIDVSASRNDTNVPIGGSVIATGGPTGSGALVAASAGFDYGNVGGKLTVLWQNQADIILLNQLGVTVTYAIKMSVYK